MFIFGVALGIIASFSFLKNFTNISRGIIDFRSILYFISLILLFLYFNTLVIDNTKD